MYETAIYIENIKICFDYNWHLDIVKIFHYKVCITIIE